jgi:GTP-binding protein
LAGKTREKIPVNKSVYWLENSLYFRRLNFDIWLLMSLSADFYKSCNDVRSIPSDGRTQIAFAGRSNVGKSTLLNKLANKKKLAKTSKTPGRTRLINFFLINNAFYFVDLPGYGFAKASREERNKWGKLVEEYLNHSKSLKGLIMLLDCRRTPNEDDIMLIDWIKSRKVNFTLVLTKTDKLSNNKIKIHSDKISNMLGVEPIIFSALSGIGKKELWKWIDNLTKN